MTYFSDNYSKEGWLCSLYSPYAHGAYNLGQTFSACSFCGDEEGPGLWQRVKHLGAGVALLIPVVNTVIFIANWKFCNAPPQAPAPSKPSAPKPKADPQPSSKKKSAKPRKEKQKISYEYTEAVVGAGELEQRITTYKTQSQKTKFKQAREIQAQFDLEINQAIKHLNSIKGELTEEDEKGAEIDRLINLLTAQKFKQSSPTPKKGRRPQKGDTLSRSEKIHYSKQTTPIGQLKQYVLAVKRDLDAIKEERTSRELGHTRHIHNYDNLDEAEAMVKGRALENLKGFHAQMVKQNLTPEDQVFLQQALNQLEQQFLGQKKTQSTPIDTKALSERADALIRSCPGNKREDRNKRIAILAEVNDVRDQLLIAKLFLPEGTTRTALGQKVRELEEFAADKLILRQYDNATRLEKARYTREFFSRNNKQTPKCSDRSYNLKKRSHHLLPTQYTLRQLKGVTQGANSLCGYYALFFMSQLVNKQGGRSEGLFAQSLNQFLSVVFKMRSTWSDDKQILFKREGRVTKRTIGQDMQNLRETEVHKLIETCPTLAHLKKRDDLYFFRTADVQRWQGKDVGDKKKFGAADLYSSVVLRSLSPFIPLGEIPMEKRQLQDTIYIMFKSESAKHYLCVQVDGLLSDKWTFTYIHSGRGVVAKGGGIGKREHTLLMRELAKLKESMQPAIDKTDEEESD